MSMSDREALIQDYVDSLTRQDVQRVPFKELVSDINAENFVGISAESEIQVTMERIRMMKIKQIELSTKEMFLEKIRDAKSLDDAVPSVQEVVNIDVSLQGQKTNLRAIKARRADAEKRLDEMARTIDSATASRERARAEAMESVRMAKASSRLEYVKNTLNNGDASDLERMVKDVDNLDSICCQHIVRELRSQKRHFEKEASSQSARCEDLRREVEALDGDVQHLEDRRASLQKRVSEKGKEDSNVSTLHREWTIQEKLEGLLSALYGVRIRDIRESGMTLEINASVFAKKEEGSKPQKAATHTLDVEFDVNEVGDVVIAHMYLDPPDVFVSDLVKDLDLSMEKGIQTVFSRFKRLFEQNSTNA